MKYWPGLVTILYGVIIFVVVSFSLIIGFHPTSDTLGNGPIGTLIDFYSAWQFWIFLAVLMAAQACLLVVPVAISNNKPISRRLLFFPIVTSAFALSILFSGIFFSLSEVITKGLAGDNLLLVSLSVLILAWIIWGFIFYRWSKKTKTPTFINRQMSFLLKGSILELLVAIPAHIYVRSKDYCCAGFGTFIGIVFGLSVMIFSFGPGVVFLYLQRIGRLKPKNKTS